MTQIIRGTTPTIIFQFSDISVEDITDAVLSVKQSGATIVTASADDAWFDTVDNTIAWTLTQEQTLGIDNRTGSIVCDWVTSDGLRGRSVEEFFSVGQPGVEDVL